MNDIIKVLKKRRHGLRARIKHERASYSKLRHKSRRIRLASPIGPRIGFFTDRLQELEIVIELIEGKITAKDFIMKQNGDRTDEIVMTIHKLFQYQP